jgi:hypothetical protein
MDIVFIAYGVGVFLLGFLAGQCSDRRGSD